MQEPADAYVKSVSVDETKSLAVEGFTDYGYEDKQGRHIVDALEGEEVYLGIRVRTPDGRPVAGAEASIRVEGTSRLLRSDLVTANDGVLTFDAVSGEMGADLVVASVGEHRVEFIINTVRELEDGTPPLPAVEGGLPWEELMKAKVQFKEWGVVSKFPKGIQAKAGKTVKLSGFMVPLEPEMEQKLFLLTSAPPTCFFHMPGGPAGFVEVTAKEGVATTDRPIIVEGRFEPQASSKEDIVYVLRDARLVDP